MLSVYAACPSTEGRAPQQYREHLADVTSWAESAGLRGFLVYSDNDSLDPWSVAQFIIDRTDRTVPMIAVNPAYAHPFDTARAISTLGYIHGRGVDLNYVSGGFSRHLRQIGDDLDHDGRYGRLLEYADLVGRLLREEKPVTYAGEHYRLKAAAVSPALPPELLPRVFVSGSSEACVRAHEALGAVRLTYPREILEYDGGAPLGNIGVGLGIIARDDPEEAWAVARERFPADRMGEKLHSLASRLVESRWHIDLSQDAEGPRESDDVYWLYPFLSGRTFSPYLVGSHAEVGKLVARYMAHGVSTVILDDVAGHDDLHHTMAALAHAESLCPRASAGPVDSLTR
jgi:alkanesulfonate monooxygenase